MRYWPGLNAAPSTSGSSVRPSLLVVTLFSFFQAAPSCTASSTFMPAPGLPFAVSSTCVVSLPMKYLLQSPPRDVADLLERGVELGVRIIPQPALHFAHHAVPVRMQAQGHDAREAELVPVGPVQALHPLQLGPGQAGEAERSEE